MLPVITNHNQRSIFVWIFRYDLYRFCNLKFGNSNIGSSSICRYPYV